MPKVRWVLSYEFCSKFHQLRFTKVQRVYRWEVFWRHSLILITVIITIMLSVVLEKLFDDIYVCANCCSL